MVEEVQKAGGTALAIPADLGDGSAPADIVRRVLESLGTIDILANNVGIGSSSGPNPVVEFDDALWHKDVSVESDCSLQANQSCPSDHAREEVGPNYQHRLDQR